MKEKSNLDIMAERIENIVNRAIEGNTEVIAEKVVNKLKSNNQVKEVNYYRLVERLLYNYNNLIDAIDDKEEAIKDLKEYGVKSKSKSITVYGGSSGNSEEDRYFNLMYKYKLQKLETEREAKRIENALNKIKTDKYYKIIELKYLVDDKDKIKTDEALAEELKKDRSTITRNRKRIMNRLITIMFPESLM